MDNRFIDTNVNTVHGSCQYSFHVLVLIVSCYYGIIRTVFIIIEESGMLLEDLKQQLVDVKGRIETLRRHL